MFRPSEIPILIVLVATGAIITSILVKNVLRPTGNTATCIEIMEQLGETK